MHSIARVSVQFVYFHLYVLCLVYDEYDNKAIIIIIYKSVGWMLLRVLSYAIIRVCGVIPTIRTVI